MAPTVQVVLDNPTNFRNPFQFEITFECLQELEDGEYASAGSGAVALRVIGFVPGLIITACLRLISVCVAILPPSHVLPWMELVTFGMEGNLRWQCRGHACGPGA